MHSVISMPCETPDKELDAGEVELGFGAGDGVLEVFVEAAVAIEPG